VYCGIPAANHAFAEVVAILAEPAAGSQQAAERTQPEVKSEKVKSER
jgi:hypothetical protein